MRRLRLSHAFVLILAMSGGAAAQNAAVIGSKHDFNGQGCSACHAVQGGAAAADNDESDLGQLWDRDLLARTFQTYDVPAASSNAGTTEKPAADADLRMSSLLCVSCHDGVGTADIIAAPRTNATAGKSSSMAGGGQHPVNVPLNHDKDPGLAPVAAIMQNLKLFGPGKTVQCSTCHDVHSTLNSMFLRMGNRDVGLCASCHL